MPEAKTRKSRVGVEITSHKGGRTERGLAVMTPQTAVEKLSQKAYAEVAILDFSLLLAIGFREETSALLKKILNSIPDAISASQLMANAATSKRYSRNMP